MLNKKTIVFALVFALLLSLTAFVACTKGGEALEVTFSGYGEAQTLNEGESIDVPTVTLNAGQRLLGWATSQNAVKAKVTGASLTYDELQELAAEGKVTLYAVIENTVTVTVKGITEEATTLSDLTLNTAKLPAVAISSRQIFAGWATEEDAAEAVLSSDAVINYDSVKDLAQNARLTLYPVVDTYDLMIAVHASHSNGNVYVSDAQLAELKAEMNKALVAADKTAKVYWNRVDAVSAANFAAEVVKKDYDAVLSSKSIDADLQAISTSVRLSEATDGDGKLLYPMTELTCVTLNQARQVGLLTGHENEETYPCGVFAYDFFTRIIDKTIEVTFTNGTESEKITIAKVADGALNTTAYEPENTNISAAPEGKVLYGWARTADAEEEEVSTVTFTNIESLAADGKITLYPVFKTAPDLYVSIFSVNGNNVYVTEEEYNGIVNGFTAYLDDLHVDYADKKIQIDYFVGNSSAFYKEVSKTYIHVLIGASALSNDTYAQHWTLDTDHFAKAVNVSFTYGTRYVGLREGVAENNQLAVHFFNYLCNDDVTVTFEVDGETTTAQTLNSLTGNEAETPDVAEENGYALMGWATTADAAEAQVTGKVTYASVAALATNGAVKLYPVLAHYDLIVYIWGGQSATGTTYATQAEVDALETAFIASLGEAATGKDILFKRIVGQTASYASQIGGNANVIISGQNMDTEAQCAHLLTTTGISKMLVSNFTFTAARYAGFCAGSEENELAVALMKYLCEKTIQLTLVIDENGTEGAVQQLSSYTKNAADLSAVTAPSGKELLGWATTANAEEAEIVGELTYASVSAYATNGVLKLYPVFGSAYDLIVSVWSVNGSSTYATTEQIEAMVTAFNTARESAGLAALNIYTVAVSGGTSAYPGNIPTNTQVILSGKNVASQCVNLVTSNASSVQCAEVVNVTFSSTRYAAICKNNESDEKVIAFVEFLCEKTIEVTFSVDGTASEAQTVSLLYGTTATAPAVTAGEGKTFLGWNTDGTATTAQIASDADIDYAAVKSLAANGAVTLYAIVVDDSSLIEYDLIIYVLQGTASKTYITDAEVASMTSKFVAYLKDVKNDSQAEEYEIDVRSNPGAAGADFNAAVLKAGDVDVVVGAGNLASQGTAEQKALYANSTATTITNSDVIANTSRAVYIISTCNSSHATLAELFVEFLTYTGSGE